ncbi:FecR domain-containing protein [Candidatus Collierbacteria bacterium]|nr:FecR domain-containing protein [Candidatus Collierbacteria bacterium]
MKKIIPLIVTFVFIFFAASSHTYAQSSDCIKEFNDVKPICDQAISNQNLLDKCEQANNTFHACLGLDKNPWKLESSKPGHLDCGEWKKLMIAGTAENCAFPVAELFEKKLWCLSPTADIAQIRSYPIDYVLDFDPNSCVTTEDDVRQFKLGRQTTKPVSKFVRDIQNYFKLFGNKTPLLSKETTQPQKSQSNLIVEPAKALNDWIKDTFTEVDFEAVEAERLYGRTPQMTEEVVKKAQEKWKAMIKSVDSDKSESPYRLDILNGQVQIKYPGENEWKDIKVGDRIPNGSTLFTGMDATTVLSIQDKGVVQILPFTEITISEWGLEQATTNKKITTDIELRTGEIELNVEGGAFTAGSSMEVNAAYTTSSVRGTHFWVKHDGKKKTDTIGVYEGKVEVKTDDGKTTMISSDGDKPGVVVVTQKLLTLKLILIGVVLTVFIGVVIKSLL